jgi:hypothetical protein
MSVLECGNDQQTRPIIRDTQPTRRPRKAAEVAMEGDTRKPSGERRSAADGPTPAGRTRRSRRAERERKQGPARPCTPQSARPDQRSAQGPRTETSPRTTKGDSSGTASVTASPAAVGRSSIRRKPEPIETSNQKGAMELAKRLEQYWHGKGFPAARFWAEPIGERFDKIGSYEIYRVASNLVDGLPPRYLDEPRRSR